MLLPHFSISWLQQRSTSTHSFYAQTISSAEWRQYLRRHLSAYFAPLLSNYVPSPPVLQWEVILPTVLCNAALYYLLGVLVTAVRQRRSTAQRSEQDDA